MALEYAELQEYRGETVGDAGRPSVASVTVMATPGEMKMPRADRALGRGARLAGGDALEVAPGWRPAAGAGGSTRPAG